MSYTIAEERDKYKTILSVPKNLDINPHMHHRDMLLQYEEMKSIGVANSKEKCLANNVYVPHIIPLMVSSRMPLLQYEEMKRKLYETYMITIQLLKAIYDVHQNINRNSLRHFFCDGKQVAIILLFYGNTIYRSCQFKRKMSWNIHGNKHSLFRHIYRRIFKAG